ncbi:hypothetical protein SCP_0600250 [Sparassis crispa]|uniref:Transmembrane protein n=1 Tax=Sparassis crispa TaxID=139825 RepID=A0A401GPA5_9APHY|nr:hypothetical protein SCP_0600250 [Sparassis crispa]GBE84048.1 hypothetical protein SCP_0600250 [Sparassis crispa]
MLNLMPCEHEQYRLPQSDPRAKRFVVIVGFLFLRTLILSIVFVLAISTEECVVDSLQVCAIHAAPAMVPAVVQVEPPERPHVVTY